MQLHLKYMPKSLQNNRNYVMEAIKINSKNIQYASDEIRDDRSVVLNAVKYNGLNLKYASERLQNDMKIVSIAVENNGLSIEYASAKLKSNLKIIEKAINENKNALVFINTINNNDYNIFVQLIKNKENLFKKSLDNYNQKFEKQLSNKNCHKNDILLYEMSNIKSNKINKEYALKIIEDNSNLSKFFPNKLKNDHDIIKKIIDINPSIISEIKEINTDDKNIIKLLDNAKPSLSLLELARSDKMSNNKEFLLNYIKNNNFYLFMPKNFLNDKSFILTALKNNYRIYNLLNDKMAADEKIIEQFIISCKVQHPLFKIGGDYALSNKTNFQHLNELSNESDLSIYFQ